MEQISSVIPETNISTILKPKMVICVVCGNEFACFNNADKCDDCNSKKNKPVYEPGIYYDVPKRFENCIFENYLIKNEKNRSAVEKLKSIDLDGTENIFIYGNQSGIGKTHLAVALLKSIMHQIGFDSRGYCDRCKMISAPNLFLEIKNSFDKEDTSESDIINKYLHYRWLLIDDIGVERVSDWSMQVWYIIIDNRYSAMLPTIYTSNLSPRELADKLGSRIASRLLSGMVCEITGTDARITK